MSSKEGEIEDENETNGKKSGSRKRRQSEKDDDSSDEEAIISNHKDQRRSTQIDNEIRDSRNWFNVSLFRQTVFQHFIYSAFYKI